MADIGQISQMGKPELKNRPLKVLYISHLSALDGAEKCLLTLVRGLDKDKFIPVVVVPAEGPLNKKLEEHGIKVFVFPLACWIPLQRDASYMNNRDMFARCKRLAALIKDEGIDIVHTNTSIIAEGAIAAKMAGKPHVWHLHEILEGHPSIDPAMPLYLIYRFIDLFSESIIAVSGALKDRIIDSINPERIKVIHNGIEVSERDPEKKTLREELKIPNNTTLVCTIGPIIKEKGYDTFVEAAKRVIEKNKEIVFISVGDMGDYALSSSLRKAIRKSSIKGFFRFLGYRQDVFRILKEIDIYVVSSRTESFSLTTIEAMAAGKPVVSTRCGGPEEIVVEGETGFLVPIESPEEMAKKVLYFADNPKKRVDFGAMGRQRFETLFTADKYIRAIERLYGMITVSKRELKGEDEKLARSLMELVIDLNDSRGILRAGEKKGIHLFVIYIHDVVKKYIEVCYTQSFLVANKRAFGFISNLLKKLNFEKIKRP